MPEPTDNAYQLLLDAKAPRGPGRPRARDTDHQHGDPVAQARADIEYANQMRAAAIFWGEETLPLRFSPGPEITVEVGLAAAELEHAAHDSLRTMHSERLEKLRYLGSVLTPQDREVLNAEVRMLQHEHAMRQEAESAYERAMFAPDGLKAQPDDLLARVAHLARQHADAAQARNAEAGVDSVYGPVPGRDVAGTVADLAELEQAFRGEVYSRAEEAGVDLGDPQAIAASRAVASKSPSVAAYIANRFETQRVVAQLATPSMQAAADLRGVENALPGAQERRDDHKARHRPWRAKQRLVWDRQLAEKEAILTRLQDRQSEIRAAHSNIDSLDGQLDALEERRAVLYGRADRLLEQAVDEKVEQGPEWLLQAVGARPDVAGLAQWTRMAHDLTSFRLRNGITDEQDVDIARAAPGLALQLDAYRQNAGLEQAATRGQQIGVGI